MTRGEIFMSLRSRAPRDLRTLLNKVESLGQTSSEVLGIGLITVSSNCSRDCIYCGYRVSNASPDKFRLSRSEILGSAELARGSGIRSVILKAGEDPRLSPEAVSELVRTLSSMGFSVSLSMGERTPGTLQRWRDAGASSYWLRQETCDPHLYRRIKPAMYWVDRMRSLEAIGRAGFSLGTGIMVGIPNQTWESLLEDLMLLAGMDVAQLVAEPFNPPPGSPGYELARKPENIIVPADVHTMEKVIALCRLLRPRARIALSRAHAEMFSALDSDRLFKAGANAIVLDFTPRPRQAFEGLAPFAGISGDDPGALEDVKARLEKMGLKLAFETAGNG